MFTAWQMYEVYGFQELNYYSTTRAELREFTSMRLWDLDFAEYMGGP